MATNSTGNTKDFNNIGGLEKQTRLTSSPEGLSQLQHLKDACINTEMLYFVFLQILTNTVSLNDPSTYINPDGKSITIDPITKQQWAKELIYYVNEYRFSKIKTDTPAGQNKFFDATGSQGASVLNQQQVESSPVTGSTRNIPPYCEAVVKNVHPTFVQELEKYCTLIKQRAYLALPASSFGSVSQIVSQINGVISSFQNIIYSVYRGAIAAIQQFYAYINGILLKIQKLMFSVIEQIIPLDLICLILEAVQTIMDDINFFTSLFGQTGSIFQYLNTFQSYINRASVLVSNPVTTLEAYIPKDIKNLVQMADQIGSDPNGFLTDKLANYGFGWALNAMQGNIAGAVLSKYGMQYAAVGPIGQLLGQMGNYPRNMEYYPPSPAILGPNIYHVGGVNRDENFNKFPYVTSVTLSSLGVNLKNLENQINGLGSSVKSLF